MSDFIRREDLVKELNAQFAVGDITREIANDILNSIPSVELKQKKGKWLWDEEEDRCYCSECGEEDDLSIDGVYMMHDFCPNCGADMRIHEIGRDRP